MRFALPGRLQEQFAAECPKGWTCRKEYSVLPEEYVRLLGYRPQADVLLQSKISEERIWIELEVSRADPVANHTKFGSAHLNLRAEPRSTFKQLVGRTSGTLRDLKYDQTPQLVGPSAVLNKVIPGEISK